MHAKKVVKRKSVKRVKPVSSRRKHAIRERMMDMHEDMLHRKEDMIHRDAERIDKKDAKIHRLLSKLHRKESRSMPESIKKDVRIARGEKKIEKVMDEFKHGMLHSGSTRGPKVKSRRQALAIALNSARRTRRK